ncbi:MAG: methyltransferase domain-containing protein [Actinomycetota bacterium]|nr:methyltransferase domain-containing protein [Actinomycetota bacterium]
MEELLAEAEHAAVGGWDFGWLTGRVSAGGLAWEFGALVDDACAKASSVLDVGTGGGEFLDARQGLPARTVATESWAPNVAVAGRRLGARGVGVVHAEAAGGNAHQDRSRPVGGRLPFRAGAFDLVVCRHEAFVASEVARVLGAGGRFVTQQAASSSDQLRQLLALEPAPHPAMDLDLLVSQTRAGGLVVDDARAGCETVTFADIGALAWYLRMVPWAVPGFTVDRYRDALTAAAREDLKLYQERYYLAAHP